jgi:methylated-DNA-[protein]-cysteine S-methyltransferase
MTIEASDRGVYHIAFGEHAAGGEHHGPSSPAMLARVARQIEEYFAGDRVGFDLPLDLPGDGFRTRAWRAVAAIPYGETWSYGQVAEAAGNPLAYRAAGSACRMNPLPIVIPCHRVIGADKSMHGYTGGGLDTKLWLLAHEAKVVGETAPPALGRA